VTPAIRYRGVLRLAAAALSIFMIVVLAQAIRRDGPAALEAWRNAHVRWPWVMFSVASAFAGYSIYILGWRRLLTDAAIRTSFWPLARMLFVSNLGRYLPAGKAWQMAIVAMMAAEQQLPTAAVAASSLFQAVVGVGVGALVLFAAGSAALGVAAAWFTLPIVAVLSLLFAPAVIRSLPRLRAAIVRHLPGIDSVTAGTMLALIVTSAASWIMWGIALYGVARALLPAAVAPISAYVAAWTGSFLAGLIAVVSPAGLGAREGIMQAVLSRAGMAAADVLVLVVVTRVWATLLDVVPAAIVLMWRRQSRRNDRPSSSAGERLL
jgi:glycosyltransferase 2 family protein